MISPHAALIHTMVLVAAADQNMTDAETSTIGDIMRNLPVFHGYDFEQLAVDARACVELLRDSDGLDRILRQIRNALPAKLHETAYALACDVAAADGNVTQEEARLLEMIRHELSIERLAAAAIERAARARHQTL